MMITIEVNKQAINVLDVALNLTKNSYQPYAKTQHDTSIRSQGGQSPLPSVIIKNILAGFNKTNDSHPSHPSSHVYTKLQHHTKKPYVIADINTSYATNQLSQARKRHEAKRHPLV